EPYRPDRRFDDLVLQAALRRHAVSPRSAAAAQPEAQPEQVHADERGCRVNGEVPIRTGAWLSAQELARLSRERPSRARGAAPRLNAAQPISPSRTTADSQR